MKLRHLLLAVAGTLLVGGTPAGAATPTIAELEAAFEAGTTTCVAEVSAALQRIRRSERRGGINAVIETNPDALEIAAELDAEAEAGGELRPLHCVPTLIKDNFQTADRLSTTAGSLTMRGYHAPWDALVVARLRAAGIVIVGKANMNEWAQGVTGYSSRGGQTKNGLNPKRGPGGSSGGSAAAVGAGIVPLATGTDTGGSIQIPASYNGVVGLRSTKGLISRAGIIPAAEVSDVAGPLVGNVADLARVLGLLTGVDPRDPATAASAGHFRTDYRAYLDPAGLAGARIGVLEEAFGAPFRAKRGPLRPGFEAALERMRGAGATVVDDLPPLETRGARWQTFFTVVGPQFPPELDNWLAGPGRSAPVSSFDQVLRRSSRPPVVRRVKPQLLRTLEDIAAQPPPRGAEYRGAVRRLPRLRRATTRLMRDHHLDALVFPATGCPAPPRAGVVDPTYRCGNKDGGPLPFGANPGTIAPLLSPVTGLPVLTLPGEPLPGDQRVGISLLGRAWSEPELISLGFAFEQAG